MARSFLIFLIAGLAISLMPVRAVRADAQSPIIQENPSQTLHFASDPKGAIRAARERIAAGDLAGAIKGLTAYVNTHPTEIAPMRFLGDLYFREGNLRHASFIYREILHSVPKDKETHNRLGTVYAVENKIDAAIAQFNAALPGTDSVRDLVEVHRRKGDLASYEHEVQRAAADYPGDADMQAELGQVYAALKEPFQASTFFKRALDDDPHSLTGLNGLGLAYLSMHDYADSVAQFRKCLAIDSTAYQCQNNLGAAQLEAGQDKLAKESLDRAYQLGPEHSETLVNYGYLSDVLGDWNGAVTEYAKAINTDPYRPEAYVDIALDYESHGLYALAQAVLLKGLAANWDDGRLHFLLGRAYQAQGEKRLAIAAYKAAAASPDPDIARLAQQQVASITGNTP
jgi:tetratricopeptide (TPR) repeat protein